MRLGVLVQHLEHSVTGCVFFQHATGERREDFFRVLCVTHFSRDLAEQAGEEALDLLEEGLGLRAELQQTGLPELVHEGDGFFRVTTHLGRSFRVILEQQLDLAVEYRVRRHTLE